MMRVNESYFKRLYTFLEKEGMPFNVSEQTEFIRGRGNQVIITVKFNHTDCKWIVSARDEEFVNLIIMAREKTYYASIDIEGRCISFNGRKFSDIDKEMPEDFPKDTWEFAERMVHLKSNAMSFILDL